MIQKLRRKFILISTAALLLVLTTVIGSLVGTTYYKADQEVKAVLTTLVDHQGDIPTTATPLKGQGKMNREGIFQYRYFSVSFDQTGQIVKVNDNHISTVELEEIKALAAQYRHRRGHGHAFYDGTTYAYRRGKQGKLTTIVFLDETILMARVNQIFQSAIILGLASLALYTLLLALFSKRAIEPIIKAERRQKEFITNASHELKTPLAIISANNEMVELLNGESEWTQSNHQQITRLTQLINRLVALARLEERPAMVITKLDASAVIQTVTTNFRTLIEQDHKTLVTKISPQLHIKADEGYFTELVNIFVDNAAKYCDEGGTIKVLWRPTNKGRNATLLVANSYAAGENVDYAKFFDRFYRNDTSHNQAKQAGFGIGLSMAQHLVETFKGKLNVHYKDGMIYFVVKFKLEK